MGFPRTEGTFKENVGRGVQVQQMGLALGGRMRLSSAWWAWGLGLAALCAGPIAAVRAVLRPEQVLVIYDSRITDSRLVAEYYAGSVKVPGGVGGRPGTRPGVRVVNLANLGAPAFFPDPNIEQSDFRSRLRNPLRTWLAANDPRGEIRCLVTTRGIPFRMLDFSNLSVGDNTGAVGGSFTSGNYSASSVDSELTLLWQNLSDTEAGGGADSFADGMIINPYWPGKLATAQSSVLYSPPPIDGYPTNNRTAARVFAQVATSPATGLGQYWSRNLPGTPRYTTTPTATFLTPGDMYLVCRLDAATLNGVYAMLDRSVNPQVNVNTAVLVMDESGSDGVANTVDNSEFDNQGYPGGTGSPTFGGDDYEQSRNTLQNDGRFAAANIVYNAAANNAGFVVGPLINYQFQGLVVSGPLLMLTHYGANSSGDAPGENTMPVSAQSSRQTFPKSFTYAPGAVYNTLESFNGRCFSGLTPFFSQSSIGDFIDAGGTGGVASVWEPFSFTVPDSGQLTRSYLLGNLSWGEAAYTALPVLSWHQIVVGDPLTRLVRSTVDRNSDGTLTVEDLYTWERSPADLNRTSTITDADRQFVVDAVRPTRDADMRGRQR